LIKELPNVIATRLISNQNNQERSGAYEDVETGGTISLATTPHFLLIRTHYAVDVNHRGTSLRMAGARMVGDGRDPGSGARSEEKENEKEDDEDGEAAGGARGIAPS